MSLQVRIVQASLAVGAIAALCVAHVDDPKGRTPHPTYTGPGWCLGSCGKDEGGIAGGPPVEFPSSNVQLLAWLPVTQFDPDNESANTVEGYVSPSGREYAIIGLSHGTGFVEVTDPGSSEIIAFISSAPASSSLWRDVRVYKTATQAFCYTVTEAGSGIQVIDISNIDDGIVSIAGPNVASGATHTMFINQDSGYLYRSGGAGNGLRIYNLNASPTNPPFVVSWPDKYVHEVTVVSYTEGPYAGKEIAFACGGDNNGHVNTGVYILDVTNKQDIEQLAYYSYPQSSFCHQGWLSEDKQYFYINDELDEDNLGVSAQTRIVNISDLSNPTNAGTFTSGAGAIDHNLYFHDNRIYESNYRSGLRVFDASNPTAPVEIAFFDTWPSDNNTSFNGLWDNDPFLPSGVILGADIEKGLFIWRIGGDLLEFEYPQGQPALLNPAGDAVNVTINNLDGEVDPETATLHYAIDGGAFAQAPMQHVSGSSFSAVFPPITCGANVQWFISAQTTTGVTVRDPVGAPTSVYESLAAVAVDVAVNDEMETNTGWTVGAPGDSADTGVWVRANPVGTDAQPEDDHTPAPGTQCWVTANGSPGGSLGDDDVDGGATTLTSPVVDGTLVPDPHLVYHRWYSNNTGNEPNTDSMPVEISNNNGQTWVQLELVTENAGDWVRKDFRIADFLPPTSQMKVRFIARDLGDGSIVEAAVDDLRIESLVCGGIPGDVTGDGSVNVDDLVAVILGWGPCPAPPATCPADATGNGEVDVDDLVMVILNWS